MATPIRMPEFGTTVEEVKVVNWLKQVGQAVRKGEAICEVETDKAIMEFESYTDGVLLAQLVPAGANVEEGQIIAYIGKMGEEAPAADVAQETQATPAVQAPAPTGGAAPPPGAKVSPLIRNLARREGVDLSAVAPTGPGGHITREDILRAKATQATAAAAPAATAAPAGGKLSSRQRAVARRVSQSHRQIVPIHLECRVDMSAAMALRERAAKDTGQKVSYDAIFVYAISRILGNFPRFRSHLSGEELVPAQGANVALAVSFGEDLYTLTVFDPAAKTLAQIDTDIQMLLAKARAGQLSLAEMSGACVTISNLGMYPVVRFSVVIPPEQSAGLGIGAIEQQVLIREGQICSAPMAGVTLSVDHRTINGRQAAEFLAALKETLEKL